MKGILITAVGGIGVGSQIVESLCLPSEIPLYLVGTDVNVEYINCRDKLDAFYQVPSPSSKHYFDAVMKIINDHNIKLIFVSSIQESYWFYDNMSFFLEKNIFIIQNQESLFHLCMDKCALFDYLKAKNFPLPKYKRISSLSDCDVVDFFPVIVKPNNQAIASNHVYIAFDLLDLQLLSQYLMKNNIAILAQEWVGDATNEYSVSVTCNDKGEVEGSIAMLRRFDSAISCKSKISHNGQTYAISSGITQGTSIRNVALCHQAEAICKALDSRGPMNLQGKWAHGVFWLIDAHPAITSSVFLKALAGYNEPIWFVKKYLCNKTDSLMLYQKRSTKLMLISLGTMLQII